VTDEQGELRDRFSNCVDEMVTGDGYRLLWCHSMRKAALDATPRNRRLQQASAALAELQERLSRPRTRFRVNCRLAQKHAPIMYSVQIYRLVYRGNKSWSLCVRTTLRKTLSDESRCHASGRPKDAPDVSRLNTANVRDVFSN
jgi:hypothetical protein